MSNWIEFTFVLKTFQVHLKKLKDNLIKQILNYSFILFTRPVSPKLKKRRSFVGHFTKFYIQAKFEHLELTVVPILRSIGTLTSHHSNKTIPDKEVKYNCERTQIK